jgi:hypothetical protein
MDERRKILIPVGSEPETPHFDAEETLLSARPVVPITPVEAAEVFNARRAGVAPRAPFYRSNAFLSLIVMAAVGIGLAAGLGIARYRYLRGPAAPVAAQPAAQSPVVNDTRTATVQTPKDNPQVQAPILPEVKIEEKTTGDDTAKDDSAKVIKTGDSTKATERSTDKSSGDKDDSAKTTTPATRDKRRESANEEDEDIPRAQRRERRVRDRNDDTINIPRRMERASEQINRIREIFEGSQQRP